MNIARKSHLITRIFIFLAFFPCLVSPQALSQEKDPLAAYRDAAIKRWEKEIAKLEKLDSQEQDPEHAILYIGSSSIRRWASISEDMAPWPAIRRGYGGARFSDLAVFVERIVTPHNFDALVIFVGNDISGKDQDKSAEEVLRLFKYVVGRIREKNPRQPIFLIGITPTSSRFHVWPKVQEMHKLVQQYIDRDESLHFINTADKFIGKDGKPMDDLFVADRLHLNADGYRLWASIIKAELAKVLGQR